ncbi:HAAS signaling domain-containing protein [Bacillus massilinigeriensis]|uniref:HAAS signaling domain-containing protein n=1 Tax=Bacillus mediterraneensis TaxID=1805474 RepID=UPI0008F973E1|nr:DUF1700 domain-containing protein [Bacillus mediterraneensis]
MNKEQFLKQLNASLERLPQDERQDILQDYEEYFAIGLEKGKTEQEISASLGNPKQISRELTVSYRLDQVEQKTTAGNVMRAVWAVIGLGFFNLVIVLAPFVALVGVIIAGWVSAICFILAPFSVLINLFLGTFRWFDLFFTVGLCGIGIFLAMGMFFATSAISKGFIRYMKFNASLVKGGLKHD